MTTMRPHRRPAALLAAALLATALLALAGLSGCEDKIGDSCDFNVDCSPRGDRLCDLSSPGGYCTIENCNAESCPKESVCIAFYPVAFLNHPCNPDSEDNPECEDDPTHPDYDPWCDECTPDEVCTQNGFCAPKASARRWCMKKCKKRKDCRDDYECRETGIEGAERVLPLDEPRSDVTARFCAPKR
jgi:hypothetical protein